MSEEEAVAKAIQNAQIGLASRTQALVLYAVLGVQVGLAMMLFGAQPPIEDIFGVWVRVWLGALAVVGGVTAFVGVIWGDRTRRGWTACLVGTNLLGIWGTITALLYAVATAKTGIHISPPWDPEPLHPEMGRLFVPIVYQTLAVLLGLHVVTLAKMGRPRR